MKIRSFLRDWNATGVEGSAPARQGILKGGLHRGEFHAAFDVAKQSAWVLRLR